jgi:hypothetical protein
MTSPSKNSVVLASASYSSFQRQSSGGSMRIQYLSTKPQFQVIPVYTEALGESGGVGGPKWNPPSDLGFSPTTNPTVPRV